MKILLHLGQGKTGTTALQQSLHSAADSLRARGVYYPRFGGNAIAHHLLLPLFGNPMNLTAWTLDDLGGPEAAVRTARAAWDATCDDIRSNPPDLLILSSELLLSGTDRAEKARLAEALVKLSTDILPILYVRHPVDFYRSSLQEMLKAISRPKPPICMHWREKIEDIEATFPHPPAFLPYDPSTLPNGDIVQDFADRFLAPLIGAVELPRRQDNLGLSAEALVLMSRLRAEGGDTVEAARRVARLKGHLLDVDRLDPPTQPFTLLPEVAEAALRSATCHRWLAETGRLVIPGLDTGRIDGAPVPDWMMTAPPEAMFTHDAARLERLRRSIEHLGPGQVGGWNANAPRPSRPRLRDRFLQYLNRKIAAFNLHALENATKRSPAKNSPPKKDGKAP